MPTYKLGRRHHKHHAKLVFGIMVVLLGATVYILRDFHPQSDATIKNSAAVVKHYDAGASNKVHYDGGNFTFDLPPTWKLMSHDTSGFNDYMFQGTVGDDRTRIVHLYEDNIPLTQAVNRVLVVQPQGNQISRSGEVSDNCINYTSAAQQSAPEAIRTKIVTDKWQGTNFFCDIGNYLRNVTGTSSAAGINSLTIQGKTTGTHKFFITFTDATVSPDYSTLYMIVDSLAVK